MTAPPFSLAHGRLCIVLAALLWSTSGLFTKVLTQETVFHLDQPPLEPYPLGALDVPVQMAFYRTLFASLLLSLTLRRRDLSFRRLMLVGAVCFAAMNATFLTAMALGTVANAILLQYTAPLWMYLASIWLLGETADRRSSTVLFLGLCGIGIIVGGGWNAKELPIILVALASGVAFAGVVICLRQLRQLSSRWLTVWHQLAASLVLLPLVLPLAPPSAAQLGILVLFGLIQMGLPYWLVARGLRVVSPQEAGAITLMEPVLTPLWAFLISPQTERPRWTTFLGGALILGALVWRYWPRKEPAAINPQRAEPS